MFAIHLIEEGNSSIADLLVNNFYHQQRRSAEDFVQLLRMTKSHRAYVEASDETKNQLTRILFLLDKKHNRPTNPVYVAFRKQVTPSGDTALHFSIKEKRSTPAQ
jgi:hypothetical protein